MNTNRPAEPKRSWTRHYAARAPIWVRFAFLAVGLVALGLLTVADASEVVTAVGVLAAIFASAPVLMAIEERRRGES